MTKNRVRVRGRGRAVYKRTFTTQCECEREHFCSRERPPWLPPERFFFRRSRDVFAINQSARTFLASFSQIETCTPDRSKKRLSSSEILLCLWSLVKNRQDSWQDISHYSWNREKSCTEWQIRQRLPIKIVLVQTQYYNLLLVWHYQPHDLKWPYIISQDEPPRKPSTGFRLRVRVLFEW